MSVQQEKETSQRAVGHLDSEMCVCVIVDSSRVLTRRDQSGVEDDID